MSGPQVFVESDGDPRREQAMEGCQPVTLSSRVLTFSTLILGEGPLVVPCAETLLRHKHTIQAIVSTNDVIQDWAQEQKIPWVARQDDLLSAVDGRPVDYLFSKRWPLRGPALDERSDRVESGMIDRHLAL
jgi:hypothetical protein